MLLLSLFISLTSHALPLEQAFRSALEKNEAAQQSGERVTQAEERLTQATSAILPNLAFNAQHQVQGKPNDPLARAYFPEKQTTANFTVTQPIFRGFREFAARRNRKDLFEAEGERRRVTLISLYESVAGSYLEVLALEQDLKNLKQQLGLYSDRVKELQQRIRRGESRSTEALTAESTEASLEAEIRLTEARLKTARERFHLVTGAPVDAKLEELNRAADLKPLEQYLARVEERPDVKEAELRLEATEEEVTVARGGHWPALDAVGNYYLKRPDGFLKDVKWDAQLNLTVPLFAGGAIVSATKEASSRQRESELELSRIRREAEANIRSLHDAIRLQGEQLTALKRSTELSEKNYQVLQSESRRGLSRSIDVQLALTEYRAARRGYDQARYSHQLDLIRLDNAAAFFPAVLKDN